MGNSREAVEFLLKAWPSIINECRATLGSDLYYQAVIYHNLRQAGVPLTQMGMNVKMQIDEPVSKLFRELDLKKHEDYRGGFEPIPDVALFSPSVSADWRRRNNAVTLSSLLLTIEVKASERANGRLRSGEVIGDIEKLAAHRDEAKHRGSDFYPVMMVIDTASSPKEQMTKYGFDLSIHSAEELSVGFLYLSPELEFNSVSGHLKGAQEGRLASLAVSDSRNHTA
jgi:hypothetical protein